MNEICDQWVLGCSCDKKQWKGSVFRTFHNNIKCRYHLANILDYERELERKLDNKKNLKEMG